jgi:excisionase family DNA binding protein
MEPWLTVKDAAPIVQMSEQALYAAIREKQFPAIHIGRRVRIDPTALREWIKNSGSNTGGNSNG